MEEIVKFELSKDYVEKLSEAIEAQDAGFIRSSMDGVNPADISSLLDEFNSDNSKYVIEQLPVETAAEIISYIESSTRKEFLQSFDSKTIASYIDHIDSDDAVDILHELPVRKREEVIANLENDEKADHILDLLHYEEHCAGGLMAKELIKAKLSWTVPQCIEEIRRQAEKVQRIYSVYVVDKRGKLVGRVSLKKIILSDDKTIIKDIYDPEVVSAETFMDEEEVAALMQKYDLEAIPVVNLQGRLVGRITIDDVIDVITRLAEEERNIMAGISEDVEEDDSVWMLSRARLPWLVVGMVGGLLGARFIGIFESDIALLPAMAFFIPLITATGGNVGIQSSSLVLQSLAAKSVFSESLPKRLMKVLLVAVINGLFLAAIVFGANVLLGEGRKLAMVVSIALFSVVLLASFMGTITPIILDKININPALASGPFITTANDLLGLAVYFLVAHILYNF